MKRHPSLAHLSREHHGLGKHLEVHIRKEERQLFPLIEELCIDEVMETIDKSLSPHS